MAFDPSSIRPLEQSTSLRNAPGESYFHFTIECQIIIFAPQNGDYLRAVCHEERVTIYKGTNTGLVVLTAFVPTHISTKYILYPAIEQDVN